MTQQDEEKQEIKRKTILVVDDDISTRKYLSQLLQSEGYDVIVAGSGESGWNEYRSAKPDIVLTDVIMPGLSGLDLLRLIRKEDSRTPVLMITGHVGVQIAMEAMKIGANEFFTKPFRTEDMLQRMSECIGKRDLELELAASRSFASALAEANEKLKKEIDSYSGKQKTGAAGKYQAICGAVAHDLKGEFLHIGNSIKTVRELGNASPSIQEECDMIDRSVEYSQLLLRRLLDYVDIGRPKVESISVLELLRRTELLVRPRVPSGIHFKITANLRIREEIVSGDIEQLMGVLLELINNAGNVLREKGGTIDLEIEEMKGELAISVKDNGPGVAKELRHRLFKEQVSSKSGLGLGLFLSNKVITALGGKLKLLASSKKGTTFTILLPITND